MADAANASNGAIQTAINATADGGTVNVPAGTATWTGSVTIPNTKGITLKGAGSGSTIIAPNGNNITMATTTGRSPLRITGFRFTHPSDAAARTIVITGTAQNWRIDNNIFNDNNVNGAYTINVGNDSKNVDSFTYGVIDHNQWININYGTAIYQQWGRGNLDPDPNGYDTGIWLWSQASSAQIGTAQAVYVEDNSFANSASGEAGQLIEGRFAAKYVVRYNTVQNPWVSSHSGITPQGCNPLWMETYKNVFTDNAQYYTNPQVEMRSVGGIVWGNTSASPLNQFAIGVDFERAWRTGSGIWGARADGTAVVDENTATTATNRGWRCFGQPGWGPPQPSNMNNPTFMGLFCWGNRDGGSLVDLEIFNNTPYTSNHLQFGRELFNESNMVGIGTLANRPATCSYNATTKVRDVYVATDQNAQGATIYVATATNTWTKHWEPYTYPHPLISSAATPPVGTPVLSVR